MLVYTLNQSLWIAALKEMDKPDFKSKYEPGSAKGAIDRDLIHKVFDSSHRHFHVADSREVQVRTYDLEPKMAARLDNDYKYHSPKDDQPERYVLIREAAKTLAILILKLSPPSREQSVALTHLDEVVMNTNAAIARNE